MTSTSETQDQAPNMDEESRRNYIRSIIKENLKKCYTQADPTNTNNTQLMSEAEFETIFGEEDVDDSDEVFDNILQKAREEFERQKELKRKFPFFESPDDIKKPKNRKRKSKVIEDAINVMNKFKKSLLETKEPEKTISTISTSCTKINKTKTENVPVQNRSTIKIYPKWKTTETYTPIFDLPINPNWVNKKSSPKSNKMYTLKKIHNWLDNADTDFTAPASCKSIRSNAETYNSSIDNKSISSPITYISPVYENAHLPETYTSIFDLPVNLNWVNKKSSLKSNKMYTLKKIHNWLDNDADTDFIVPASCKSIRSNTATYNSSIDNKSISSSITSISPLYANTHLHEMYNTPKKIHNNHNWLYNADTDFTVPAACKNIRSNTTRCHSVIDNNKSISSTITSTNPLNSSTPLRSTIVRFRPSSPEYIPYNCDDYSSISVASTLEEEIELPDRRKLKKYYTQADPTNNTPLMSEAEFERVFGEEDADDSDEVFDNILQQSREDLNVRKN